MGKAPGPLRHLVDLALNRNTPQTREVLSNLFWTDSGHVASRRSLRQALPLLRKVLPPGSLEVEREMVTLRGGVDLDVDRFQSALAENHREAFAEELPADLGDRIERLRAQPLQAPATAGPSRCRHPRRSRERCPR